MEDGKAAAAWRSPSGGQQPLVELTARAAAAEVDAAIWQAWLADPDTRRRFEALVYRRGPDQCAYWLGAISSTGHGKFRAGSRARAQAEAGPAVPSRIVNAHVYAYQLHHGIIPAPWAGQAVIRHRCDETSCQNWDDLLIGTQPDNVRDYRDRRGREDGPLADRRGARGRAVAIRDAILTARRNGTSTEEALQQAIEAGIPPRQERLF
jgi:HNH endonuclease